MNIALFFKIKFEIFRIKIKGNVFFFPWIMISKRATNITDSQEIDFLPKTVPRESNENTFWN